MKQIMLTLFCFCLLGFSNAFSEENVGVPIKDGLPDLKIYSVGVIDNIDGHDIVINDSSFKLSPDYQVKDITSGESYFGRLTVGLKVGYELGGQRKVKVLWVISDKALYEKLCEEYNR